MSTVMTTTNSQDNDKKWNASTGMIDSVGGLFWQWNLWVN
jgi:hypothetical protein